MELLLVNDDGWQSELLATAIAVLQPYGHLTVVVPAEEQSWRGKAMTRNGTVAVEHRDIDGQPIYTVAGTPADCANIGIYHLCRQRPDLVVSGINAGENTGIAFIYSSGTVGACFEANIAGLPAVALSQRLTWESFCYFRDQRVLPPTDRARLSGQLRLLCGKLFGALLAPPGLLNEPLTWSVNFPVQAASGFPIAAARAVWDRYGSKFTPVPSVAERLLFEHDLQGRTFAVDADSEHGLTEGGVTTVALLDMGAVGRPDSKAAALLGSRLAVLCQGQT